MRIVIELDDRDIVNQISRTVQEEVDKVIKRALEKTDFETVINNRIEYHVDRSQQLNERTLRNYVQQKIARELANSIFKDQK